MSRRIAFSLVSFASLSLASSGCELVNKFEGWTPPEGNAAGRGNVAGNAGVFGKLSNPTSAGSVGSGTYAGGLGGAGGVGAIAPVSTSLGNASGAPATGNGSVGGLAGSPNAVVADPTLGGAPNAFGAAGTAGLSITQTLVGLGGAVTAGQGNVVGGVGANASAGRSDGVGSSSGSGGASGARNGGGSAATLLGGATASGGTVSGGTMASGGTTAVGGTTASGGSSSSSAAACLIESVAYPSGAKKTGNSCLVCNPATSTTNWSPASDGSKCAEGQVCSSGACTPGCWIGGSLKAPDAPNPAKGCESCQPSISLTSWSPITEGAGVGCASGQVCHNGACTAGCWIGAYQYSDKPNPANGCQVCQPTASTTAWTTVSEGITTGCSSGQVCHAGACTAGCFISSAYFSPNQAKPSVPCLACKPGTSTSAWTADATSTACGCTGTLETVDTSTGLCVSTMATIPGPTSALNYRIDATEVTRKQYAMWLAMFPSVNGQDSVCSWNAQYEANTACMADSEVCQTGCDAHPQVCVDWCDAYAYCKAAGKHLCGKIGGGPNAIADYTDSNLSAWDRVCTSGGANNFPYGGAYNSSLCNVGDSGPGTTVPVASMQSCQAGAPYSGVYDLSGSVSEWEDSCDSTTVGAAANCRARGGDYNATGMAWGMTCSADLRKTRDTVYRATGIRCCSP